MTGPSARTCRRSVRTSSSSVIPPCRGTTDFSRHPVADQRGTASSYERDRSSSVSGARCSRPTEPASPPCLASRVARHALTRQAVMVDRLQDVEYCASAFALSPATGKPAEARSTSSCHRGRCRGPRSVDAAVAGPLYASRNDSASSSSSRSRPVISTGAKAISRSLTAPFARMVWIVPSTKHIGSGSEVRAAASDSICPAVGNGVVSSGLTRRRCCRSAASCSPRPPYPTSLEHRSPSIDSEPASSGLSLSATSARARVSRARRLRRDQSSPVRPDRRCLPSTLHILIRSPSRHPGST